MKNIEKLDRGIEYYLSVMNYRKKEHFSYFFVQGYKFTQLSSVAKEWEEDALFAKIYLGMLITLIDDLADNPKCFNPKLLQILYRQKIVNDETISPSDKKIIALKNFIVNHMMGYMEGLPHFHPLIELFHFDMEKIFLSNRYSELITAKKFICNEYEMKHYGSYTMGVLAAGMIDLMAIKNIDYGDVGKCRELFIIGQRLAKIANNIATFAREKQDGDITNEIAFSLNSTNSSFDNYKIILQKEFDDGICRIRQSKNVVKNFDALVYSDGIRRLFDLNMSLIGII